MLTAKCNTVLDVCAHLSSMSLARTGKKEGWCWLLDFDSIYICVVGEYLERFMC
jgi:hypothetical protein